MYKKLVKKGGRLYTYYYHNIREEGRVKNICLGSNLKDARKKLCGLRNENYNLLDNAPEPNKRFNFGPVFVIFFILLFGFGFIYFFEDITGFVIEEGIMFGVGDTAPEIVSEESSDSSATEVSEGVVDEVSEEIIEEEIEKVLEEIVEEEIIEEEIEEVLEEIVEEEIEEVLEEIVEEEIEEVLEEIVEEEIEEVLEEIVEEEIIEEEIEEVLEEVVEEIVEEVIPVPETVGEEKIKEKKEEIVNITEENVTEIENITNITLENITIIEDNVTIFTEKTTQGEAEIGKDVKWLKVINILEKVNKIEVELPEGSFNVSVKQIQNLEEPNFDNKNIITGEVTLKQDGVFLRFLKNLFRFTGLVTAEKEESNILVIKIEKGVDKVEIGYYTKGPEISEEIISEYKKKITVYSDTHYENILAYTGIDEFEQESIKLDWLVNDSRILVDDVRYEDEDDTGLIDKIYWIVPYLSEQTYEVSIEGNFTVKSNITEDIFVNETIEGNITNITLENITNITLENITNITINNFTEETIQGEANIGGDVKWVKIIKIIGDVDEIGVKIPEEAFNVSVKQIGGKNEKINKKNLKVNGKNLNENSITGQVILNQENFLLNFLKNLFRFTGLVTAEQDENNILIIEIGEGVDKVEIGYYTKGPEISEEIISEYKKRVVVYSDIHYEDILAYTNISEFEQESIKLDWLVNDSRILVDDVRYEDEDDTGLIDKIYWIVPYLSNQTYEVTVGGNITNITLGNITNITEVNLSLINPPLIEKEYKFDKKIKRGANWEEIVNGDRHIRTIVSGLMNYLENETYSPIDLDIVSSKGAFDYEVTHNIYKTYFNFNSFKGDFVKTGFDGNWISYKLEDVNNVNAVVEGNKIIYYGIYDNIDLEYEVLKTKLKERLVMHNYSGNVFSFEIKMKGVEYGKNNGNLDFYDKDGEKVWSINKPYMYDNNFDGFNEDSFNDNINYKIIEKGNKIYIDVVLDDDWLRNAKYPVVLDPITDYSPDTGFGDGGLVNLGPTLNYGASTTIGLGTTSQASGVFKRMIIQWDISSIDSGATVNDANISLYCN
ncbi:MAG: hypothetical protein KJ674_05140, partial [Nanoarchaeota archaeon]|nr:hypothetical protein [Nanoarchaeota archaeon]